MLVDGEQRWVEYFHVDFDENDFVMLGDAYAAAGGSAWRAASRPKPGTALSRAAVTEYAGHAART